MWFIVEVVKGSKYFEPDSRIGNRVLISDTTELVICGRATGTDSYRFEARRSGDNFVLKDFPGSPTAEMLSDQFTVLAKQFGAMAR